MKNENENGIQVFENDEFGKIRMIEINGEPWFIGKDVANILGYTNSRKALSDHVDFEDRNTVTIRYGTSGNPNQVVINESGLYSLMLSSKLPSAKRFKHWITSEVLPSIRKHGVYMTDNLLEQVMHRPELILQMANVLVQTNAEKIAMEQELEVAKPKAEYFDRYIDPDDCTNIRNTAKELEIPERKFVEYLLDHNYLYRDSEHRLMPHSLYRQKGWFAMRDVYLANDRMVQQTLITCRGKFHLNNILHGALKGGELE